MEQITKINRKVRIKPCAKIFVGIIAVATKVTDNLLFYVEFDTCEGVSGGLWFDVNELEFLK